MCLHFNTLNYSADTGKKSNIKTSNNTLTFLSSTEVEPMFVESDNLHVIALTAATGVRVRIMYLDRGSNEKASAHDFPEDAEAVDVHILYRPGHYDILYPK